jgi:hypothetical protein
MKNKLRKNGNKKHIQLIKSIYKYSSFDDIMKRFYQDNLGKFKTVDGNIVMLYTHSFDAPFIKITLLKCYSQ